MKIAVLIARVLLGLVFFVFGLNNILHFMKMAPPPGDAGTFATLLISHNLMTFVGLLMVIGGLLLLVGRFVPIGLVLLGPILGTFCCSTCCLRAGPASGSARCARCWRCS